MVEFAMNVNESMQESDLPLTLMPRRCSVWVNPNGGKLRAQKIKATLEGEADRREVKSLAKA